MEIKGCIFPRCEGGLKCPLAEPPEICKADNGKFYNDEIIELEKKGYRRRRSGEKDSRNKTQGILQKMVCRSSTGTQRIYAPKILSKEKRIKQWEKYKYTCVRYAEKNTSRTRCGQVAIRVAENVLKSERINSKAREGKE